MLKQTLVTVDATGVFKTYFKIISYVILKRLIWLCVSKQNLKFVYKLLGKHICARTCKTPFVTIFTMKVFFERPNFIVNIVIISRPK